MNRLICTKCHTSYPLDDPRWKCVCNSVLDIDFRSTIDIEKIKARKSNLWRYREVIPVIHDENIISFDEGFTPLIKINYAGAEALIKLEQLFPTGSFKDRGATVLISKLKELGINEIIEDSSGNAGSAYAAYCAKAGITCNIFVPESTVPAKITQIGMYGAILHKISGSRLDTSIAAQNAGQNNFYANHSWNPFFLHGTKTFAYEIWEQLNFNAPDTLIIPTGSGTLLIGTYLGFKELLLQNHIKKIPKLIAVQSVHCAPLYKMYHDKLDEIPLIQSSDTIAEGIAIAQPVRANQIINIINETKGDILVVDDIEIKRALIEIARIGLLIEPTSAIVFAALKKYRKSKNEIIVVPITGHGLKTSEKLQKIYKEEYS